MAVELSPCSHVRLVESCEVCDSVEQGLGNRGCGLLHHPLPPPPPPLPHLLYHWVALLLHVRGLLSGCPGACAASWMVIHQVSSLCVCEVSRFSPLDGATLIEMRSGT